MCVLPKLHKCLYALRMFRAHGLADPALHVVTPATTMTQLHTLLQLGSLTSTKDKTTLEGFRGKVIWMGYIQTNAPTIVEPVRAAEFLSSLLGRTL